AFLGINHIDLDASLGSEFLEQRVDQIRLAIGVDVHLARSFCLGVCSKQGNKERKRNSARERDWHHFLQWPGFKAPVSDLNMPQGPSPESAFLRLMPRIRGCQQEYPNEINLRSLLIFSRAGKISGAKV